MSEFKQLKFPVEQPNNPVGEIAEQGEFYPELRESPFWPTAKDIRIGRIGLYYARQALEKGGQERSEPKQAKATTRPPRSPFPQWPS